MARQAREDLCGGRTDPGVERHPESALRATHLSHSTRYPRPRVRSLDFKIEATPAEPSSRRPTFAPTVTAGASAKCPCPLSVTLPASGPAPPVRRESQATIEHQECCVVDRLVRLDGDRDQSGGGFGHVASVHLDGGHPRGLVKFPVVLMGNINAIDHARHLPLMTSPGSGAKTRYQRIYRGDCWGTDRPALADPTPRLTGSSARTRPSKHEGRDHRRGRSAGGSSRSLLLAVGVAAART